jgi:large subunit ribosomal protein L3
MAAKGILGRKLGMTQVWDAQNRVVPVTVIEAGPCRVVQLKTPERDGYAAVQLAFGAAKPSRLSKPELGHLAKAGVDPLRELAELRVDDLSGYEVGQVIAADVFAAGDVVDVTGISKGKGFTGVMQRHNFKGQGASHGNHKKHRAPGAIGACATPARVFKGVRMAGQHGAQKVTTLNLEVVEGDPERGLLLVRGSVPGANGSLVFVRNAVKGPKVGPYEPSAKTEPAAENAPEADGAGGDADTGDSDAERAPAAGVSPAAASDAVEAVSPAAASDAVEAVSPAAASDAVEEEVA